MQPFDAACCCVSWAGCITYVSVHSHLKVWCLHLQGFPSKIRSPEQGMLGDTETRQQAKQAELQKSILDLGIAWSLALVCCTHHLGHWLHSLGLHQFAHLPILNTMHQTFSNPAASAALGAVALLGPGRKLLVDGALSLARYNPACLTLSFGLQASH